MLTLAAAAILMITMGTRQATGLFVSPINTATGLGIVAISFALAVGQFVWGAAQPVFGAVADKFAAGFINAGGSRGQFVFAPLMQAISSSAGWVAALLTMAVTSLLAIPLAGPLRERRRAPHIPPPAASPATASAPALNPGGPAPLQLGEQLRATLRDPSYLPLHAGFFTCGFHIAFLITHLPGEVALCNLSAGVSATALIELFNIAGSLAAGALVNLPIKEAPVMAKSAPRPIPA